MGADAETRTSAMDALAASVLPTQSRGVCVRDARICSLLFLLRDKTSQNHDHAARLTPLSLVGARVRVNLYVL